MGIIMRKLKLYQVDAFASSVFTGNPAAVCPLETWLTDETMQHIAAENNLSETAFFVPQGNGYHIRWFTPNTEVALCGHATLASAYVIFECLGHSSDEIIFQSQSGELRVKKHNELLQLDFPALDYKKIEPSQKLVDVLTIKPQEVFESQFDLLCVFGDEAEVRLANPNLSAIAKLHYRGIILTALSSHADVYSRCFYPGCDVPEDPVTGSAHCVIAPYWCHRFHKTRIHAIQGLKRRGELICEVENGRVLLSGGCHLYFEGTIYIPEHLV